MKRINYIIFSVILALSFTRLFAQYQDVKFERISINEGLSQVVVQNLNCDSKGYIWAGTQDGLNRYDGYDFKIYRPDFLNPENSLSSNGILSFYEDAQSNIWLSTVNGLNFYNRKFEKFRHWISNGKNIDNIYIIAITGDHFGNIWLVSLNKISKLKYDSQLDKTEIDELSFKIENKTVKIPKPLNIKTDRQGNIWVQTQTNQLYFIAVNETANKTPAAKLVEYFTDDSTKISGASMYGINVDKYGNIWLLSENYITKFSVNSKYKISSKSFGLSEMPSLNTIQTFYVDKKENLLIGTNFGLVIYQNKFTQKFIYDNQINNPFSLSQNFVLSIVEDDFGILWIGTTKGLNKYDTRKTQFKHIAPQPLNTQWLRDEYVYCFSEDTVTSEIWIGTFNGHGIYIYNPKSNKIRNITAVAKHPDSLSSNQIRTILQDGQNTVWIGTEGGGLCKYDKKTKKFTRYYNNANNKNSLPNNTIYTIVKDKKNNLWIGTNYGLCKFDLTTLTFTNYSDFHDNLSNNTLNNTAIRAILIDSKETLWFGTLAGGLHKMINDNNKISFKNYKSNILDTNALSSGQIMNIFESTDGYLWVATFGGGFNRFDRDKEIFTRFTISKGLASNVVYGFLEDQNQNLWLSTNCGLSVFNLRTKKLKNYTIENGLQSNEFNSSAFMKSVDKKMFFGGINGYNVFYPQNILMDSIPPKLVFTDLKINNFVVVPSESAAIHESMLSAKQIELNYLDRDFIIEFAAIHFAAPKKNTYAYMMDGYDKEWINIGNRRFVSFSSFPAGEYTFKVKAANSDGVWNNKGISIKLIIHPPFWKTKLFYSALTLLLLIFIFIYIKLRERNLKREKQLLERKVVLRTKQIEQQKNQILEKNEELRQQQDEIVAQRDEIETQRNELLIQRDLVVRQKQNITDSIMYASRIQNAVLPRLELINQIIPSNFILYKPRDIVSGDFYFVKQIKNFTLLAVADCTGHGVPGAFMSMLGVAILNEIVQKNEIKSANILLNELRRQIKFSLQQTGQMGEQQDGMDIAFCAINLENYMLSFSGAYNPLCIFRNKTLTTVEPLSMLDYELIELPADRMPVGVYAKEQSFTEKTFQLQHGDMLYLFSDGYHSQLGGPRFEKYKSKRMKAFFAQICNKELDEQKILLETEFDTWRKSYEQTDDVLVMGVRI